ncbi:MAG: hypothetical protein H7A49_01170 [Akkermansiaceae bacterium]|nr:hypothetical protein [Akkermansiaceae bacterium]MCP5542495.1 hypothetical protein [Akkermansiaceae bacterium]MCP5545970.1 hypothetical protein [Akkermansiaceae bacterium]
MKRCWIHIGMHKTGTTSVQSNLADTPDPDGWTILKTGGRPNMGMALYAMFATEPHKFHLFAKKGLSEEQVAEKGERLRRQLRKSIERTTAETVVISGEAACLIDAAGIVAMKDFLGPLFDEVRVIGYVRPPMGYKTSIFQQHLKYAAHPLDFSTIRVAYRRKFEKFDRAFGKENVLLCKFAPETFAGGCIVADFCARIGIKPPPAASIRRVNEGMTREACGILYAWRKFGPGVERGKDYIRENNRIVAPLLALSGTRFRVSPELLHAGADPAAKPYRWIERRLGESLAETSGTQGAAITCEEDLLEIPVEFCREYRRRFEEIHGVSVPAFDLPSSGPVNPERIAALVEACRHAKTASPAGRGFLGSLKNLFCKAPGSDRPGIST